MVTKSDHSLIVFIKIRRLYPSGPTLVDEFVPAFLAFHGVEQSDGGDFGWFLVRFPLQTGVEFVTSLVGIESFKDH